MLTGLYGLADVRRSLRYNDVDQTGTLDWVSEAFDRPSWPVKWRRGTFTASWFERHGSTPITGLPSHWPDAYRRSIERRIEIIEAEQRHWPH